jgi:glyoxylase I family protein
VPTNDALALHHLAVVVGDLDRAEAFYAQVLGLCAVRRWDDAQGRARSVWMGLGGGAFLALEKAGESTRGSGARGDADQDPGWHCVALAIAPEERGAWRGRLAAAGVRIERESPYTLYLRDPDGNLLGLSHYPAEAP